MIINEEIIQNTAAVQQTALLREQLTGEDWEVLESGYANYRSEKLEKVSSERLEVKQSASTKFVEALIMLFSLILIVIGFKNAFPKLLGIDADPELLGGMVFCLGGSWFLYTFFKRFIADDTLGVFDKRLCRYWEGDASLTQESEIIKLEKQCRLSTVVAVQLLSGTHRNTDGDPSPIEQLNLVLRDKSRVNILAYADRAAMMKEAAILASFLGVPVWADIEEKRAKNTPLFAKK